MASTRRKNIWFNVLFRFQYQSPMLRVKDRMKSLEIKWLMKFPKAQLYLITSDPLVTRLCNYYRKRKKNYPVCSEDRLTFFSSLCITSYIWLLTLFQTFLDLIIGVCACACVCVCEKESAQCSKQSGRSQNLKN